MFEQAPATGEKNTFTLRVKMRFSPFTRGGSAQNSLIQELV